MMSVQIVLRDNLNAKIHLNLQAFGLVFPVAQLLCRSAGIEREASGRGFRSPVAEHPPEGFRVRAKGVVL